jgi:DNA-binding response OmpR family regulator
MLYIDMEGQAEWHAGARDLRTVDTYISQLRKALIQDGETDPSEVPAIDSLKHASEMD